MTMKNDTKLEKNWLVVSKIGKIEEFWSEHWKTSKMCTFIGSFCANYIIFDLKKYRGVIFHDTKE